MCGCKVHDLKCDLKIHFDPASNETTRELTKRDTKTELYGQKQRVLQTMGNVNVPQKVCFDLLVGTGEMKKNSKAYTVECKHTQYFAHIVHV